MFLGKLVREWEVGEIREEIKEGTIFGLVV